MTNDYKFGFLSADDLDAIEDSVRKRITNKGAVAAALVALSEILAKRGMVIAPKEPTKAMLKAAFVAMNNTPSGEWKRLKAAGLSARELFDAKMTPRYRAMIAATPRGTGNAG